MRFQLYANEKLNLYMVVEWHLHKIIRAFLVLFPTIR